MSAGGNYKISWIGTAKDGPLDISLKKVYRCEPIIGVCHRTSSADSFILRARCAGTKIRLPFSPFLFFHLSFLLLLVPFFFCLFYFLSFFWVLICSLFFLLLCFKLVFFYDLLKSGRKQKRSNKVPGRRHCFFKASQHY